MGEIKIGRRVVLFFACLCVLIIGSVGISAIGSVENPGHAISELQVCDEGEMLVTRDGAWACEAQVVDVGDYRLGICGTGKPTCDQNACPESYTYIQHVGETDYDRDGNRYVALCQRI